MHSFFTQDAVELDIFGGSAAFRDVDFIRSTCTFRIVFSLVADNVFQVSISGISGSPASLVQLVNVQSERAGISISDASLVLLDGIIATRSFFDPCTLTYL